MRQALGGLRDEVRAGRELSSPRQIVITMAAVAGILLLFHPAIGGEQRDLTGILDRLPEDPLLAEYSHPAWERLVELRESDVRTVDAEKWESAQKDLDLVIGHLKRLKTEPYYPAFFRVRQNVRYHPIYREMEYVVRVRYPWVLFMESSGSAEKDETRASEILDTLEAVQADLHRLFGDRLSLPLPDTETLESPGHRVLKVWVFTKKQSFRNYFRKVRDPMAPGTLSTYRRADRWLIAFRDRYGLDPAFPLWIGNDATHQLMHLYRKVLLGRHLGEEVFWEDRRLRSRCSWFREGIAEFIAGGLKVRTDRLALWRKSRREKDTEWTLEELLAMQISGEVNQRATRKALGNFNERSRLIAMYLFEAWAWVHFLYHFEDGKYREKLLAYADMEFHGASGPAVFNRVWGADDDYDWSPIEKEWHAWMDGLPEK